MENTQDTKRTIIEQSRIPGDGKQVMMDIFASLPSEVVEVIDPALAARIYQVYTNKKRAIESKDQKAWEKVLLDEIAILMEIR